MCTTHQHNWDLHLKSHKQAEVAIYEKNSSFMIETILVNQFFFLFFLGLPKYLPSMRHHFQGKTSTDTETSTACCKPEWNFLLQKQIITNKKLINQVNLRKQKKKKKKIKWFGSCIDDKIDCSKKWKYFLSQVWRNLQKEWIWDCQNLRWRE